MVRDLLDAGPRRSSVADLLNVDPVLSSVTAQALSLRGARGRGAARATAAGVVPGAVLSPENRRRVFVWYASFLEFGNLLAYEELWFCLAMARTRACILT